MSLICRNFIARWLALLALLPTAVFSSPRDLIGAEPAKLERVPWNTSRVTGSPDPPPPFKIVRAFPNLKFERPLLLARCPGSDRLFVGEQAGVLYSFPNRPDATAEPFFDLRKELTTLQLLPDAKDVDAVYGLVFHPDFERNRQCFVCYTLRGKNARERNLKDGTRVSRFTVTKSEPPRIDPASEEIVLTFLQGGHNGGDLHFGPDHMLYISTGDAANPNPPDPFNTGQDVSDLLSSILRIDVDHRDEGQNYAVPKDNPFVGLPSARPEVWAYGFRNPWRMSFDRQTGELFVGDVGWELWEMVHRIEKGGNYGWSAMEGPQPIKPEQVGPTPLLPPLIELSHAIACSITGGYVYRGKKFPELRGAYVFGDWETKRIWAARFDGDKVKEMPEITRPSVRIGAFGEDNGGELYILDHDNGTIHTLERNDAGSENLNFPTRLSDTGLFASVREHKPAEGVVPFQICSRQWQDGANAEYLAAFPGTSSAIYHAIGKPVPGLVYWHNFRMHFPKDAVLARTLSLGPTRVETQLLHYDGVDWRAYTYAWRDDQADADLVPPDGAEKELRIGGRNRVWQFLSRSQCMSCHSNQSEYALGFVPEQLNRPGPGGRNQLVSLTELGLIRRADKNGEFLPPFDDASAALERKVANPTDESQPIDVRARAYLHANCGHCHSDHGGGAVSLRLQCFTPAAEMKAIDVRPTRGDFGLPDAAIIKPGDPLGSTLYFRMAKFGRDRMPHIGSELPDEAGLKLVEGWIAGLDSGTESAAAPAGNSTYDQLLPNPKLALQLARKLGQNGVKPADRDALLAAALKLPPSPVRDLFEGYLPIDEHGERKLGSNPRPKVILALKGDARAGEELFWSKAVDCGKCHRVGDRGAAVGPELSNIGKQRSREELLESLLAPSRRVEPKFAQYVAKTADGRSLSGVLIKRDVHSVVLRDGQGKDTAVSAGEMEELRPLRTSLMPDGQMAGLTAQQAADLLEYLATRNSDASVSASAIEFRPVAAFLKLPEGMTLGPCSGVDIDSRGNVYVIQRRSPPILCFDSSGKLLRSWGTSLIGRDPDMVGAHGIRIDKDNFVWITDRDRHLVRKFDQTGQLLLTLGTERSPGTGPNQFNRPTDIAFGASGEIYVADGYGNSRVVKFDRHGKFLKTWGEKGDGPGQFDLPHTIAVGLDGRIYVGDRYNSRIQIFDSEGKLQEIWPGFVPCGMAFDRAGNLFVADGVSKVLLIDRGGKIVKWWGLEADQLGLKEEQRVVPPIENPGGWRFVPHLMSVDGRGNLYLADVPNQMLHRFDRN